jgi:hypothetical protein
MARSVSGVFGAAQRPQGGNKTSAFTLNDPEGMGEAERQRPQVRYFLPHLEGAY